MNNSEGHRFDRKVFLVDEVTILRDQLRQAKEFHLKEMRAKDDEITALMCQIDTLKSIVKGADVVFRMQKTVI